MNILVLGDIVGRVGRKGVKEVIPKILEKYSVDFIIANGENAAGGNGITPEIAKELFAMGINVLTMGNHTWDKKELFAIINDETRIIRPANYPPGTPGQGYGIFKVKGKSIAVVNLMGRVFMSDLDCPFRKMDELLSELHKADYIVVDFHAEATSEKVALGWYLDGKVSLVFGTHTHVPTADERILPGGTAYITDIGMSGPINSVIGVKTNLVLQKFLTQMPQRFESASGPYIVSGIVVKLGQRGMAEDIIRIQYIERE
ncbi:TIGR00282 family metallophosphoesterase [Carboxydothermus pertinax]|uniref:Ser/Thr protein phosphatase family protein n=1 Tax=Carboxydothermus pertinax TaxID=870242 RepID=A0A1L8CW44_9THEO|nr:TIGR00282 family metallophosphoesterase [Carboxydothermus pertinax]GAV23117.1 Ser/Thr protein phosphatase family protein [Carboxydothermus pertinax]